ncbi:hypothetical protein PR202_ga05676 [Eleusine coracana subsp. coracana]|uniref:Transcription repressor n=1 Tax=Eleusine coracana subsp. coracana TaxID=191504 RepID=A0AAV5BUM5_ELECO|nr:hypothetical protein QOZ80_5AG0366550 [Eleusine coracana subsp. coracana]GJM89078.1 hypothetical protein PR202_ga05222 [Eleusine coracana subsp. coracana]GJM89479.1 hypothetical protein PR202_ga05676 [Eleusine coracana subsp. coracana]
MRWGIRKQQNAAVQCVREDERDRRGGKGKGRAFSFSPLSWLGKLAGNKEKHKNGAPVPGPAFPSCLPKRTSPSPAVVAPGRACSPDGVPRRLSVDNNDNARRHGQHQRRRRHCSLGGDRELPPLGHLIPFSLTGSPALPPRAAVPSDTDGAPVRAHRRRRRRSSSSSNRRLSSGGIGSERRSSLSSRSGRTAKVPVRATVRVRSPRRAAPELERLAVVRRTRDPQRAFRESMVEMVAGSGGRTEELERLLACYLSLNADEHHECIVKVFRQVWFEYISLLRQRRPDSSAGRRRDDDDH